MNPIAGIIINARHVMMEGIRPEFKLMAVDFVYAGLLLAAGLALLNKLGSLASEKL